jgi:hypothetical protein
MLHPAVVSRPAGYWEAPSSNSDRVEGFSLPSAHPEYYQESNDAIGHYTIKA